MRPEEAPRLGQGDPDGEPRLEQIAEPPSERSIVRRGMTLRVDRSEAVGEADEHLFGGKLRAGCRQRAMQASRLADEVRARGPVHHGAHEGLGHPACVEIGDALAEAGASLRSASVMRDSRGQQGRLRPIGDVRSASEVVHDGAHVDQEERPIRVCVRGVHVRGHPGVEHFPNPGHGRMPGPDRGAVTHTRNVQDPAAETRDDRGMVIEPVRFPTRIALVLSEDLEPWQAVNVAAFLASGIASEAALLGHPYVDADGATYLPLLGQPVMVLQGDGDTLQRIREKSLGRDLRTAIYDRGMFATGDDAANREVVAGSAGVDLDLVGVAVHGAKNVVDRVLKGVSRHR